MSTLNSINKKLRSVNNKILDAYNGAVSQPIPAAYIRQNLTLIGLKEGYRFYEDEQGNNGTLLTLTQDVNPDFEDRSVQNDKTRITDHKKAQFIFGTSQALHDRGFKTLDNGATLQNGDYNYGSLQATELNSATFNLNGDDTGYNPSFEDETVSEPMISHLASFCGSAVNGDYPYRYITSGAPASVYRMAQTLSGKEGPFGSFKGVAKTRLSSQGYDPVGGLTFNDVNLFAESISTIYGTIS